MDIVNDLRSFTTVGFFILFLGIAAWAYSSRNRSAFDEAAALPFLDEDNKTSNGGTHE
ncbi:cbb3-type cytochrome c oxidase subunit 3 [Sphaerotilus montanus]|jgi:cytochrome c oxidase cbb3-type subunit 4|uniref:Cytochrome c oxidase cbb3-type subunit 4 n=1 Tax=Sphaerotilus montanus TaxID=522889 RepID=A0A7Y9QV06_9BURK|nr:cbb3-type cytochrome c oxidase subunit 3 [Sphaerotilus montanus]NYG31144.1 cytochrome c oxidase cbb3-type subunit 4 [Sphaerotilus montanus]NZD55130.1 cbb3-type cytochrome c oxidase subunit 3 [Sphaerotilus montanus]